MIRKLLFNLTSRLPCRIIDEAGQPYLERYYLAGFGSYRIYVHRFVGSDPDRGLHSHPWKWALSIVLAGWYFEERFSGTQTPTIRRVRRLNFLLGESFHRVILPRDWLNQAPYMSPDMRPTIAQAMKVRDCWTLFIHKAQAGGRRWGFIRPAARQEDARFASPPQVFTPFVYPGGATRSGEWWKSVPKGRDEARRLPL